MGFSYVGWVWDAFLRGWRDPASGLGSRTTGEDAVRRALGTEDVFARAYVVTGTTSGIGWETVRALAGVGGAFVVCLDRSPLRQKAAMERVRREFPEARLVGVTCDLSDLASVRSACVQVLRVTRDTGIHAVVNNAGVMGCPPSRSAQGHELQFATNHLGHYLLNRLLAPRLLATCAPGSGVQARVVCVGSAMSQMNNVYERGLAWNAMVEGADAEGYGYGFHAYCRSKLCVALHARRLNAELKAGSGGGADSNAVAVCVDPGSIRTELFRHSRLVHALSWVGTTMRVVKSPAQGAGTQCLLATMPEDALAQVPEGPGGFWRDCHALPASGQAPEAVDDALADMVWERSADLCADFLDPL